MSNATAVDLHGMISAVAYLPIETTVVEASQVIKIVVVVVVVKWRSILIVCRP